MAVLEWGWRGEAIAASGVWNVQNTSVNTVFYYPTTVIPEWIANVEQVEPSSPDGTYEEIIEGLRNMDKPVQ